MEDKKTICKNCEQEIQESFQFCPYCGQKVKDDLTMGVLFYNTISNYFSVDARFLKSFFPLLFRPGYLAKKFVEGKRLLYLHPAQFYLFSSVIFFFIFSFQAREYNQKADNFLKKGFENDQIIKFDSIQKNNLDSVPITKLTKPLRDQHIITGMDEEELKKLDSIIKTEAHSEDIDPINFGFNKKELDSLIAAGAPEAELLKSMGMDDDAGFLKRRFYLQMLKFQKNSGGGIMQAFFDSIPIALFFLLPIFAFILKIFYWKRGSFPHHLVFSFYYFSFLFMVMGIVMFVNFFWKTPDWVDGIVAASAYIYLLIAVKQFYRQGYFVSFIKTGMVAFIYLIFVLPIALVVMLAASFLFY
jgi:hypothetical protein